MEAFRVHTGLVAPLDRPNVDTDQIIPKQFLKRIERSGFGQFLFHDWRFDASGAPDPTFALNSHRYAGASVLVAGRNFGCGSSREHAPWAIQDYGFRVVIAPSFADIFATNCLKIGLLPVALSDIVVEELVACAGSIADYRLTVDLERLEVRDGEGLRTDFQLDELARSYLLEGLDEIGLTLRYEADIGRFEERRASH